MCKFDATVALWDDVYLQFLWSYRRSCCFFKEKTLALHILVRFSNSISHFFKTVVWNFLSRSNWNTGLEFMYFIMMEKKSKMKSLTCKTAWEIHYCVCFKQIYEAIAQCVSVLPRCFSPTVALFYTHINNWSSFSVSCTSDMVVLSAGVDLNYSLPYSSLFQDGCTAALALH